MHSTSTQGEDNEMITDIKTLREKYNLSRKQFTEMFDIPYRTLQDWELGNRKCPEYLLKLIEYKLEKEQS
jgi:DNA-binding transcriptional regulator YiaG